jgi:hypothetical protein
MTWAPQRVAALVVEVRKGLTGSQIAAALNQQFDWSRPLTRASVSGKLERLRKSQPELAGLHLAGTNGASGAVDRPRPAVRTEAIEHAKGTGIPFLAHTAGKCLFPLWGRGEKLGFVCGKPAPEGQTYCAVHHRVCWKPINHYGTRAPQWVRR